MKKILVIGGSYFIGRVFTMVARQDSELSLTLLNRGRFQLPYPDITQLKCDRYDATLLKQTLVAHKFDVVIDFCAYEKGDIAEVLSAFPDPPKHYIYISSAAVYTSSNSPHTENSPLVEFSDNTTAGNYALGKKLLEDELITECSRLGTAFTILRPTMVYGPYNYAPRESFYFDLALKGEPCPLIADRDPSWNMVYVKDVAFGIIAAIKNTAAINNIYNLAGNESLTYRSFIDAVERVHGSVARIGLTMDEIVANRIPVPFSAEFNELYDASKATTELGINFTPFDDGLRLAYNAHKTTYAARNQ